MTTNKMILKAAILKKLRRHVYWGEKHTVFDELSKGLPKHLRGETKKVVEEMLKEGLLLPKSTNYGLHGFRDCCEEKYIFCRKNIMAKGELQEKTSNTKCVNPLIR